MGYSPWGHKESHMTEWLTLLDLCCLTQSRTNSIDITTPSLLDFVILLCTVLLIEAIRYLIFIPYFLLTF